MNDPAGATRRFPRGALVSRYQIMAFALGVVLAFLCTIVRVADPHELRLVRELVFDAFQRLSPRPLVSVPVRVIDIDERSLATTGQWPWPRSELVRLVERLDALGPAVIAFDILFPEPDRLSPSRLVEQPELRLAFGASRDAIASRVPDHDRSFAAAIANRPVVLGFAALPGVGEKRPAVKAGIAFTGKNPTAALPSFAAATVNLPALDAAAKGVGAITVSPLDTHGVIRQIPLLWGGGQTIYPSLVIETLRVMQNETTLLVHSRQEAPFAVTAIKVGQYTVPTTASGELRVRYSREPGARVISAERFLSANAPSDLRELIAGHAVLIGTSATGLHDNRVTPLGDTVPGVLVHAQALEQILVEDHLQRPDWADAMEWIWMMILSGMTIVVAVLCSPVTALIYGGGMALITCLGAWFAFRQAGLLLDPAFSCATGLLLYIAMISFRYFVSDRDRRFVRQAFARYVAPSYLEQLEKEPDRLKLGGDERPMTVLFVDVRGFTSLSERLSPMEVVDFLNVLFGRLSMDVLAEGGTIDKYIGDSIMAFWNAPLRMTDHASRACTAALRMRRTLRELNEGDAFRFRQRADPLPDVAIGIGINSGMALVGNMGSESRFNYSVVGDTVNVASRVEGQTKRLGVDAMAAESVTVSAESFAYLEAGTIELRGKRQSERLFVLVGDASTAASPEFSALRTSHRVLLQNLDDPVICRRCLKECRDLTESGFPWLVPFYDRLARRLAIPERSDGLRAQEH